MLMLNICYVNVSGRSCGPSPYIFGIYLFYSEPQFEKTGSENLEKSLYLCILWFWILIMASNYQLYTFQNIALCL